MSGNSGNFRHFFSAESGVPITPADDVIFPPTRAIFVGTGGTFVVQFVSGVQCTFTNVPDGTTLPIAIVELRSTGLVGATDFIGLS